MLTGQAKTDYQREYMRRRRSNTRSNTKPVSVRPKPDIVRPLTIGTVRPMKSKPEGMSANQWAYIQTKEEAQDE